MSAASFFRTSSRLMAAALKPAKANVFTRVVAALGMTSFIIGASPLWAATFAVNTTADGTDGVCATTAGGCTLRDAIKAANATTTADVITLPAGTYTLTVAGSGEDAAATGDLDVLRPVTITGAGAGTTIIDAGRLDRVFDIFGTAGIVTLQQLTVRNGFSGTGQLAGGIWNSATLTLNQVRVESSEGRLGGGGILNDNDLTANDVTLSGNSTISQGGGLYNTGIARLQRVTVSGNTSAAIGAGIGNDGTLTLTNVTISGNTAATDGGGLDNGVTATLKSVTLAANGANRGGNVFAPGDTTFGNTLVANATSGGNCNNAGSVTSLGANLDSANTCGFTGANDQINKNPLLTPLQNNGGPTLTHGLFLGSPAVDLGGSSCPGTLTTDQRGTGFPRVLDGDGNGTALCDAGAYELDRTSPPTTTTTTTNTTTSSTTSTSSTSSSTSTSRPTTTSTSSSSSTSSSTSTSRPTTTSTSGSSSTSSSTSTSRPSTTSTSSSSSTSSSTSTSRPSTTSSSTSTTRSSTSSSPSSSTTSSSTSSSTSTTRSSTSSSTSSSRSTSSSSTSTTTATSTTLVGCGAPRTDCIAPAEALVAIEEGTPGRERLKLVLRKLVPEVVQAQFGNPATGTTRYDVCIYDDALRLVGSLNVDRAGALCGDPPTRACWRSIFNKGYRYTDREAAADGVRNIVATGGSAGRGRLVVKARNDGRRAQTSMPTGIAAALQLTQSVTVQAVTSDGDCFGGTLTDVRSAGPTTFRAQ